MELPERPAPARSLADRAVAWAHWVGIGRLVASAGAILAVVAGGYWLVKPPAATTESKLPYATSTSTALPVTTSTATPGTTTASIATSDTAIAVVHIAGAVQAPGVYQLAAGSRVIDAVQAAGGLAADANPDAVNLAALVADGQRVYVPALGEAITSVGVGAVDAGPELEQWPINLNSADSVRLQDLPGVGPATALAIVAHRDAHGPFASVEQLTDVRGIGPAKLEAIRALVTV